MFQVLFNCFALLPYKRNSMLVKKTENIFKGNYKSERVAFHYISPKIIKPSIVFSCTIIEIIVCIERLTVKLKLQVNSLEIKTQIIFITHIFLQLLLLY